MLQASTGKIGRVSKYSANYFEKDKTRDNTNERVCISISDDENQDNH